MRKTRITKIAAAVLSVLMCFGLIATTMTVILPMLSANAEDAVDSSINTMAYTDNITLTAFWPPTAEYTTDAQYKLMADAGINWLMGSGDPSLDSPAMLKKMLTLCEKYGISMTVGGSQFGDNLLGKSESEIAALVNQYKDYPAAMGFYLRDEPTTPNDYLDAYIAVKKAAPYADGHLNFFPSYIYASEEAYRAQMNDWCRVTAAAGYPVDYLMFDFYPYPVGQGMEQEQFLTNTRSCWEVGLQNQVKTGMYIQTIEIPGSRRRPNEAELRYEMYTALAYGYKNLSFFTWFTPTNRSEPFNDGIIAADGTPNEHYEIIKKINHEILAIGTTLAKCDALEVWFAGKNTFGQPEIPDDFFVQTGNGARTMATLSLLRHSETGRNYLMVVNNNYKAAQNLDLTFDVAITSLSEVSREDGSLKPLTMDGQKLSIRLAAGDAMLIALPEDLDYAKPVASGQPAATVNLAADALILSPSSVGTDDFFLAYLNDGSRIAGTSVLANGWKSTSAEDTYVELDLGRILKFNRIDLYAGGALFAHGEGFPKSIKVSVSNDGKNYTDVKSYTDVTPAALTANCLTFDMQSARYIRLDLGGMSANDTFISLNEIEVYCDDGTVPAPEKLTLSSGSQIIVDYTEGENIALGKPAMASTTSPESYRQWGWALDYINDGKLNVDGLAYAWTSQTGINKTADATEYVCIDFGDVFAVEQVVVTPNGAFPEDYVIDLSADGIEWTVIDEATGANKPSGDIVLNLEQPVEARYVRMTATKLRMGGNASDGYLFQLGEIEAYGKPVCDKTVLQTAIDTYKSEGGDEAAKLYTNALTALDNALLTQSRANDWAKQLYTAIGYNPDGTKPEFETKPETDPETETTPESDTVRAPETDATTPADTTLETEAPQESGCSSVLGISALVSLILTISSVSVIKKRE